MKIVINLFPGETTYIIIELTIAMTVKKPKKVAGHKALQIAGDSESAMNKIRLPYLLLESAATEESPDQGLDEDC